MVRLYCLDEPIRVSEDSQPIALPERLNEKLACSFFETMIAAGLGGLSAGSMWKVPP